MKNIFRTIFVLSIVFFNAALIFGQEKPLEKSVFQSIVEQAKAKLEGKTYRTVNTYETFDDPKAAPVKTVKTVTEQVPPDRFRMIEERGGQKTEIIDIGAKRYIRHNDGEWKLDAGAGVGGGMGCGASVESESYKVIENEKLDGKSVNFYEMTEKVKEVICEGKSGAEIWIKRYWISKDGFLLKTENVFEKVEKKSLTRDLTIYQYDPKIKIEAPIK